MTLGTLALNFKFMLINLGHTVISVCIVLMCPKIKALSLVQKGMKVSRPTV